MQLPAGRAYLGLNVVTVQVEASRVAVTVASAHATIAVACTLQRVVSRRHCRYKPTTATTTKVECLHQLH
jgi:hypothetical protein